MEDPQAALDELAGGRRGCATSPAHLYLQAQLLMATGRPAEALTLIDRAAGAFRDADAHLDAARCDAGRSNVLEALGRLDEALAAARRWVAWLQAASVPPPREHVVLLAQARANLGLRLENAGDYVGALAAHDAAIDAVTAVGDDELVATMQINRANVLNLLGRSPEAFDALAGAAELFARTGNDEDLGVVAINAGESLCRMGRPDEGLQWFVRAERLVRHGSPDHVVLLVETADALGALGAVDEAALRYGDAFALLGDTPLGWLEGRMWTGLAAAHLSAGRFAEAATALMQASGLHLAAGNLPAWAVAEADALVATAGAAPDRQPRVEALRSWVDDTDDERWPVQVSLVRLRLAELLADEPDEAERQLRAAGRLARSTGVPHLGVRAGQQLARLLVAGGRTDEADVVLGPVLDAAEGLRGQLHADELLRAFPSTVAAAYDALVDVRLAQGRVDDAMWSADASRSRAMTELDVAPGGNLTERSALDAQLDATYDRLLALDGSVSLDLRRQLDARARDLEARLGRVRLDALRSTPRPKRRGSTDRERPADGEVQAIYRVAGDRIGVFVRHGDEVAFEADVARVPDVVAHLEAFRSIGRQAVALAGAGPAVTRRLVPPAAARLAWLGDHLLAPLEAHLGAARRVVVVPHDILHGVPFHALTTAGRPLLDHVEVAVAPSLSWRTSEGRRSTAGRTVVIGYGGPELPGVDAEVDAIVRLLPESIVLRHGEATIDGVRSAIQGASCVHLATHGTFRPGAPLQSGIRLADGWLSARALAQFDLRGAMVVLSACDTGRTVVDAGDELLGLQRGFWLAGARSIVMSLWPAVDEAAVTTMTALHTGVLDGLDDTAAIRRSWQVAREHHPHPWWWAPFIAVER